MKHGALFVAVALAVSSPALAETVWQLDPARSSTQFAVTRMGISTVRGTFTKLNGTARYDPADLKNDSVEVTIDAASIDTRMEMRDNDLRSDHFFDTAKYPTITFKSVSVESSGAGNLKIAGDLTIRGIAKRTTLDVQGPSKAVDDGRGHLHMGISATGSVNRSDFGMTGYPGMVGNEIKLTIDAEFVMPAPSTAKQ